MLTRIISPVIVVLSFLLMSCKVYTPQPVPAAMLSAKNDLSISGGIAVPFMGSSSIAYSPIKGFGIQSYASVSAENSHYFQGNLIHYWKDPSQRNYEVSVGTAWGTGKTVKATKPGTLKGDFLTCFSQLTIRQASNTFMNVDYGIGMKLGLMSVDITDNGYYESDGLDPVMYSNSYFLVEPLAFARFGERKVRFGLQVSGASLINIRESQRLIPYNTVSLGFTLLYKFSGDKRK